MVRSFQPNAVISSRSGWIGDFDSAEGESETKGPIRARPWEKCMRINTRGWGYTKEENLLSADQCIVHLVNAVVRNGNLLLNVGPDPDGVIPKTQVKVLNDIGQWLKANGEAVYGTRAGPFQPTDGVYGSTHRDDTVYVHVLKWPAERLKLPAIPQKIVSAQLLGGGEIRFKQTTGEITIEKPGQDPAGPVDIIKLRLDGAVPGIVWQ
jgi:alpha-L-fucosidase